MDEKKDFIEEWKRQEVSLAELCRGATTTRWIVLAVTFVLAVLPGEGLGLVRVVSPIVLLCFVAWPNFANHLSQGIKHFNQGRTR